MKLLSDPLALALGWALLSFVWQGALIGLVAGFGLAMLRRARPQSRYALACAALLACVLVPLWSLSGWHGASAALVPVASMAASTPAWLPDAVQLWLLGAVAMTLRLLLGCAWVTRLKAQGEAAAPAWQQRLDQIALAMGFTRAVSLRVLSRLDGPVAIGIWKPVVMLPAALLSRLPVEYVEALLAHELAHIRRHDYLVNLMQGIAESLLFYHPVVWWLSRRIREEREMVADDLATRAIGHSRTLALALQQLDFLQAGNPITRLAPAAHGGNLMNRIKRLIRPDTQGFNWKGGLPVLVLAAIACTVVARTVPSDQSPREPYALVRAGEDGMMLSGNIRDIADVKATRPHVKGDFIWFRRDGKPWIVQDPVVLASARRAWQPAQELGGRMEALGARMEPHSQRMQELGRKMEVLAKAQQPQHERLQELSKRMQPLNGDQQALAAEMDALAAALQEASKPMEALGREMEAASAPMEALGKQMEVLGKQQERISVAADARVKQLIDSALREGKAVPAPRNEH